jgi:ElaB/YqjD/DUF883 family membrane-anchored ribosome-binding protein
MAEPAADPASPLHDEWRDLLADIEDLVKQVGGLDDAAIAQVRDRVTASLTGIKTRLADGAEQARDVAGTVDDYVHSKPWQSLGVAAVVGLLFGLMLSSRD